MLDVFMLLDVLNSLSWVDLLKIRIGLTMQLRFSSTIIYTLALDSCDAKTLCCWLSILSFIRQGLAKKIFTGANTI